MAVLQLALTRDGPVLGAERAGPGVFEHPLYSAPGAWRHTESGIRKSVKNYDETASVIVYVRSKVGSPEVTKSQILPFQHFS